MAPEPPPGPSGRDSASAAGQFAAGHPLDAASPGPGLATALANAEAALESLDDDALAGFLGGCQKIAAWASGMLLDGKRTVGEWVTVAGSRRKAGRPSLGRKGCSVICGVLGYRARWSSVLQSFSSSWAGAPLASRIPVASPCDPQRVPLACGTCGDSRRTECHPFASHGLGVADLVVFA